jgi:hypothetical protein
MSDIFNLTDTWNAGATVFSAIKMNVTDTASAAGSLLIDLQVGGTSKFKVDKTGALTAAGVTASGNIQSGSFMLGGSGGSNFYAFSSSAIMWSDGATNIVFGNYAIPTTNFNMLKFGGVSASFPALKRSAAALQVRLADDSAFAVIQGKLTTDAAYTATVQTSTGYITLYDSTGTAYKVLVAA